MYTKIESSFWQDDKMRDLSEDARYLMLYFLSSPHRNILGFYYLPIPYACFDVQWPEERFQEGLQELLDNGRIKYDFETHVVLVINYLKHNPLENPNQAKAAITKLDELPDTPLMQDFETVLEQFDKPFMEPLCERLLERLGKPVTVAVTVTVTETVTEAVTEQEDIPPASPIELSIMKELKTITGYPFDYTKDLDYIRSMLVDFADLDVMDEVKKWAVYKRDRPLGQKSNPRLQLRNWLAMQEICRGTEESGCQ